MAFCTEIKVINKETNEEEVYKIESSTYEDYTDEIKKLLITLNKENKVKLEVSLKDVFSNKFNYTFNLFSNKNNSKVLENFLKITNDFIQAKDFKNTELFKLIKANEEKLNLQDKEANMLMLANNLYHISKSFKQIEDVVYFDSASNDYYEFMAKFVHKDVHAFFHLVKDFHLEVSDLFNDTTSTTSITSEVFKMMSELNPSLVVKSSGNQHYFDLLKEFTKTYSLDNSIFNKSSNPVPSNVKRYSPFIVPFNKTRDNNTGNFKTLGDFLFYAPEGKKVKTLENGVEVLDVEDFVKPYTQTFQEALDFVNDINVRNEGLNLSYVDNGFKLFEKEIHSDLANRLKNTIHNSNNQLFKNKYIQFLENSVFTNKKAESLKNEILDKLNTDEYTFEAFINDLKVLEKSLYGDGYLKMELLDSYTEDGKYDNLDTTQQIRPVERLNEMLSQDLTDEDLHTAISMMIIGVLTKNKYDYYKNLDSTKPVKVKIGKANVLSSLELGKNTKNSTVNLTYPHFNKTNKEGDTRQYIPLELLLNSIENIESYGESNERNSKKIAIKDSFPNSYEGLKNLRNESSKSFVIIGGVPYFAYNISFNEKGVIYIPAFIHYRANMNEDAKDEFYSDLANQISLVNNHLLDSSGVSNDALKKEYQEVITSFVQSLTTRSQSVLPITFASQGAATDTYFIIPTYENGNSVGLISTSFKLSADVENYTSLKQDVIDLVNNSEEFNKLYNLFNTKLETLKPLLEDTSLLTQSSKNLLNTLFNTVDEDSKQLAFENFFKDVLETRDQSIIAFKKTSNKAATINSDIVIQTLVNSISAIDLYVNPFNKPGMFFHNVSSLMLNTDTIGFDVENVQREKLRESIKENKETLFNDAATQWNNKEEERVTSNKSYFEKNKLETIEALEESIKSILTDPKFISLKEQYDKETVEEDKIKKLIELLKENDNIEIFNYVYNRNIFATNDRTAWRTLRKNLISENNSQEDIDLLSKLDKDQTQDIYNNYITKISYNDDSAQDLFFELDSSILEKIWSENSITVNSLNTSTTFTAKDNLITHFIINKDLSNQREYNLELFKQKFIQFINSEIETQQKNLSNQKNISSSKKALYEKRINNLENLLDISDENLNSTYFNLFKNKIKDYYQVEKGVYMTLRESLDMQLMQFREDSSLSTDNLKGVRLLVKSLFSKLPKSKSSITEIDKTSDAIEIYETDEFYGSRLYYTTGKIFNELFEISREVNFKGSNSDILINYMKVLETKIKNNSSKKFLYTHISRIIQNEILTDSVKQAEFISIMNMVPVEYSYVDTNNSGKTKIVTGDEAMAYVFKRNLFIDQIKYKNILQQIKNTLDIKDVNKITFNDIFGILTIGEEGSQLLYKKESISDSDLNNAVVQFVNDLKNLNVFTDVENEKFDNELISRLETKDEKGKISNSFNKLVNLIDYKNLDMDSLQFVLNGLSYSKYILPTTFQQTLKYTKPTTPLLKDGFKISYISQVGKEFNAAKYADLGDTNREILKIVLAVSDKPKFLMRRYSDKSTQEIIQLNKTSDLKEAFELVNGKNVESGDGYIHMFRDSFEEKIKQELSRIYTELKKYKEDNFNSIKDEDTIYLPTTLLFNAFPVLNNNDTFKTFLKSFLRGDTKIVLNNRSFNIEDPDFIKSLANNLSKGLNLNKLDYTSYVDFINNRDQGTWYDVSFITEVKEKIAQLKQYGVIDIKDSANIFKNLPDEAIRNIKNIFGENTQSGFQEEDDDLDFLSEDDSLGETAINVQKYDELWDDYYSNDIGLTTGENERKMIFNLAKYLVLYEKAVNLEFESSNIVDDSAISAKSLSRDKYVVNNYIDPIVIDNASYTVKIPVISETLKKIGEENTKRYAKLSGGGQLSAFSRENHLTSVSKDLKIKEALIEEIVLGLTGTEQTEEKIAKREFYRAQFEGTKDATDAAQIITDIFALEVSLAEGFKLGNENTMSVLKHLFINNKNYYEFRKEVQKLAESKLKNAKNGDVVKFTLTQKILGKDTELEFTAVKKESEIPTIDDKNNYSTTVKKEIIISQNGAELPFNDFFYNKDNEYFKNIESDESFVDYNSTKSNPLVITTLSLNPLKPMEASPIMLGESVTPYKYTNYKKSAEFIVGNEYSSDSLMGQWREMHMFNNVHSMIFSTGLKQHLSDNQTLAFNETESGLEINRDFLKFNKNSKNELVFDNKNTNVLKLDLRYRFRQLDTQGDYKEETAMATQMHTNLLSGVSKSIPLSGENFNAEKASELLNKHVTNLSIIELGTFLKEFGVDLLEKETVLPISSKMSPLELKNINEKLSKGDLQLKFKEGEKGLENFRAFLQKVSDDDPSLSEKLKEIIITIPNSLTEIKTFRMPLSLIRGLEFKLTSYYSKRVLRHKLPGLPTTQSPDIFTKTLKGKNTTDKMPSTGVVLMKGKNPNEDLQPLRLADKDGNLLTKEANAEALTKYNTIIELIDNPTKALELKKDATSLKEALEEELKSLKEEYTMLPAEIVIPFNFFDKQGNPLKLSDFTDENGFLDLERIDLKLLQAVGFRIPYQGASSGYPFKIVGFTDLTVHGNMSIVPNSVLISMGSDFDVDKLNLLLFNNSLEIKEGKTYLKPYNDFKNEEEYTETLSDEEFDKFQDILDNLPEGSTFKDTIPLDKKSIGDSIIENYYNIYISPYYYNKVTTPQENEIVNTYADVLKEREVKQAPITSEVALAEDFHKGDFNTITSSVYQSFISNNNLGAKKMLGIGVVSQLTLAIGQQVGLYSKIPVYYHYDGKLLNEDLSTQGNINSIENLEDNQIFKYTDDEGNNLTEGLFKLDKIYVKHPANGKVYLFIDLFREMINIFVDAANNQDPGKIKITNDNVTYALQLIQHIPLDLALDYLNHPIISSTLKKIEFNNSIFKEGSFQGKEVKYLNVVRALVNFTESNFDKGADSIKTDISIKDLTKSEYKADLKTIEDYYSDSKKVNDKQKELQTLTINLINSILDTNYFSKVQLDNFISSYKLTPETVAELKQYVKPFIGLIGNLIEVDNMTAIGNNVMGVAKGYRKGLEKSLMDNIAMEDSMKSLEGRVDKQVLDRLMSTQYTGKSFAFIKLFNSLFKDKNNTFTFESSETMLSLFDFIKRQAGQQKLSTSQRNKLSNSVINYLYSNPLPLTEVFDLTQSQTELKNYYNEHVDLMYINLIGLMQDLSEADIKIPFLDKIQYINTGENAKLGILFDAETNSQIVEDSRIAFNLDFRKGNEKVEGIEDLYKRYTEFLSNFMLYTITTNNSIYEKYSIIPNLHPELLEKFKISESINNSIYQFKNINIEVEPEVVNGEYMYNTPQFILYDQIIRNNPELISGNNIISADKILEKIEVVNGKPVEISISKDLNVFNNYIKVVDKDKNITLYRKKSDSREEVVVYKQVSVLKNTYDFNSEIITDYNNNMTLDKDILKYVINNKGLSTTQKAKDSIDIILKTLFEIRNSKSNSKNLLNINTVSDYAKTTLLIDKFTLFKRIFDINANTSESINSFMQNLKKEILDPKSELNNTSSILEAIYKLAENTKFTPKFTNYSILLKGVNIPAKHKEKTRVRLLLEIVFNTGSNTGLGLLYNNINNLIFKYNNSKEIGNFNEDFKNIILEFTSNPENFKTQNEEEKIMGVQLINKLFYNEVNLNKNSTTLPVSNFYSNLNYLNARSKVTTPSFYLRYKVAQNIVDNDPEVRKYIQNENITLDLLNYYFSNYETNSTSGLTISTIKNIEKIYKDLDYTEAYKRIYENYLRLLNIANYKAVETFETTKAKKENKAVKNSLIKTVNLNEPFDGDNNSKFKITYSTESSYSVWESEGQDNYMEIFNDLQESDLKTLKEDNQLENYPTNVKYTFISEKQEEIEQDLKVENNEVLQFFEKTLDTTNKVKAFNAINLLKALKENGNDIVEILYLNNLESTDKTIYFKIGIKENGKVSRYDLFKTNNQGLLTPVDISNIMLMTSLKEQDSKFKEIKSIEEFETNKTNEKDLKILREDFILNRIGVKIAKALNFNSDSIKLLAAANPAESARFKQELLKPENKEYLLELLLRKACE